MLNGRPYHAAHGARPGLLAGERADARPTTRRCGATSSWRRRWASTACASIRRSRIRAICTGPTGSACWSGRRCRAPTASPRDSVERLTREWTEAIERDYSHPVHRRLGAVQRILGRARTCRTIAARAALRAGALSPDQDARSDAAGDRQRRLGERRHRHHRHPRLRRRSRAASRSATAPTTCCRGCSSASGPGGRLLVLEGDRARRAAVMLTEFGGIALSRGRGADVGLRARATRRGVRASATRSCSTSVRVARAASPASATRSSPTPTRKPTACCTPTARRSFRSSGSRAATRGPSRRARDGVEQIRGACEPQPATSR